MESQPAGGLLLTGTVSQSMAARDAQAIENLYHSNGFLHAKVTPKVEDDYQGRKAQLKLTMMIDEGPQFTVGKLTIVGNTAVSDQELRALIAASEGQPYSDTTVANDQSHVVSEYFNRGFPTVRMEYSVKPSASDPTKLDLTYKITEGQRVYVDKVLISGLHYTKPFVVDREMKIRSDDPLNQNLMLESQRRLYDLGIFNAVEMAIQNPEGDAARKNVNFQLEEARRYTFNYGVGFEVQTGQPAASTQPQGQPGASARVSFDVTRLNFRGRDHTITLKTRYGNLQKRPLVSYDPSRMSATRVTIRLIRTKARFPVLTRELPPVSLARRRVLAACCCKMRPTINSINVAGCLPAPPGLAWNRNSGRQRSFPCRSGSCRAAVTRIAALD